MTKPTKTPRWATDDEVDPTSGQNNVEEPQESEKDSGWTYQQKPPRQYFNWLSRVTNEWLTWFNARFFDGATANDFKIAAPATTGGDISVVGATTDGTSNQSGGDVFIDGGQSTGSGSSTVVLRAATAGASGTTARNAEAYLTADGSIGTITAQKPIGLANNTTSLVVRGVATAGADTGATISVNSAQGTLTSPTAVQSGNELGRIAFGGASASGTWSEEKAFVSAKASADWSASSMPTTIDMSVTASGNTTPSKIAELNPNGLTIVGAGKKISCDTTTFTYTTRIEWASRTGPFEADIRGDSTAGTVTEIAMGPYSSMTIETAPTISVPLNIFSALRSTSGVEITAITFQVSLINASASIVGRLVSVSGNTVSQERSSSLITTTGTHDILVGQSPLAVDRSKQYVIVIQLLAAAATQRARIRPHITTAFTKSEIGP